MGDADMTTALEQATQQTTQLRDDIAARIASLRVMLDEATRIRLTALSTLEVAEANGTKDDVTRARAAVALQQQIVDEIAKALALHEEELPRAQARIQKLRRLAREGVG
jgi:hypothetical protein